MCVRCGRPAGVEGREHCARCRYALAHRPAKHRCPGCGNDKVLDPATGRCVLCSRTCARCGAKAGRIGRQFCGECSRRERRAQAQQPCPRCGKPGRIRGDTGWCGPCSRPGRPSAPDAACSACGTITRLAGAGLCPRCYDKSAHRVAVRAGNLAASLDAPPAWLPGFAGYLAPRHHATRACQMITLLGRLLRDGGPVHPQALLDRASSLSVPLARALEDFFTRQHLALPPDHDERRAAGRRQRRLDAILGVFTGTVKIWYHAGIVSGQRYNDKGQILYHPPGPKPPTPHQGTPLHTRPPAQTREADESTGRGAV